MLELIMILETMTLGSFQTNCYIYASSKLKRGFVIDPADKATYIEQKVRELQVSVEAIILTHGHADHKHAALPLASNLGIPIWAHEESLHALDDRLMHSLLGFEYVASRPDKTLKDGDIIGEDEIQLKVLHTPGHSQGCISLLGCGLVFTGDALFYRSVGRTDFPGGNSYTLTESLKSKLLTLPDETAVYPGHGPDTTIGYERKSNPFLRVI